MTVDEMFGRYGVQTLIHGHTHRPAIHTLRVGEHDCRRIVLGDWYTQGSVLRVDADGGMQLSATANQFVDKIDPFSKRGTSRRRYFSRFFLFFQCFFTSFFPKKTTMFRCRRIVNSSRYHAENEPELTQLPLIRGQTLFIFWAYGLRYAVSVLKT